MSGDRFVLQCDHWQPAVAFAASEIERAVVAGGGQCKRERALLDRSASDDESASGAVRVVFAASPEAAGDVAGRLGVAPPVSDEREAYAIRIVEAAPKTIAILAHDAAGAMYGGLDVAEAVAIDALDALIDIDHQPHVLRRGIKFNIPLDARTPSYSDASDSAQQNIPEVWQIDFWRDCFDAMARHRFNVLTLWNLHPFPSMVKTPEFPDVALDDVMRTRARFDDTFDLCGHDMVRDETLADLECVHRLTIDEKIAFWREVMQLAHDRGIEVYIFTWNIFTFGADGKHGITHEQDNPTTIAYFRATIREMILTYPLLAGIGITAGERMSPRDDQFDKEPWLWRAYGEGIRDALASQPKRQFRLIHRYHQSSLDSILHAWRECPCTFDLSFKYAIAHMYSHPAPPFAREALAEMPPELRMWMTVRNDDIYSFRWGDPEYARAFIRALPGKEQLAGFYMGPDGYTWGREFLSTEPEQPRQLVIDKQWYSFMLWGRLSYDPTIASEHFERIIAARFPRTDGAALYRAIEQASRIIPQVTRFHWEALDFQWFPEACISRRSFKGFHTIRHFVENETMPESGLISVRDYAAHGVAQGDAELNTAEANDKTPPSVIARLRSHAAKARSLAAPLEADDDRELRLTLGDVAAMAHLGDYYADKIEAAQHLAFFERSGDARQRDAAVDALTRAAEHWRAYAEAAGRQYRPQLLTRIGYVDLQALTEYVDADIDLARQWPRGLDQT